MASLIWLLHGLLAVICSNTRPALAMPPAPPVKCNATGCLLSNAYGAWGDRKDCWVQTVAYPTTEDELRSAVARASQRNQKVKVASGFSHTIPKLACPPSENSTLISTAKYSTGIEVDVEKMTVTVDAGVALRDLIDKVEAAGVSLVAAPYWEGVSVGGVVSTGSHGSSWWGRGGAVHDHVVGLSLVVPAGRSEGYAKIVRLEHGDPLFNAARVSLGLLGVISKVTLSLERRFKRSVSYSYEDDSRFEDEFLDLAQKHEFADITWYPSQHKAVYRYDDRVPLNSSGDGANDFLGFQSNLIAVSSTVRATEKALEKARNVNGKCTLAATEVGFKKLVGNGLKNNVIFTGYPVVGYQGKMQTSGSCLHSPSSNILSSCAWDPRIKGLFFYETTAIFPAPKFRDFILDVKKLRDLGQSEDSVVVDFNYYRADEPSMPRLNQDIWEEVEQMAFFKYGAKPHWAKNRKLAFTGVQQKYPKMSKFLLAKRQLDPQDIFDSQWSDEILLGKESAKDDGCALEGQCICSEDRHCSPAKGYLCKPGLVYNKAMVCRYTESSAQ